MTKAVAVIPVRDGVLPAGALDVVAEVGDVAAAGASARVVVIGAGAAVAAGPLAGLVDRAEAVEAGPFAVARWAAELAGRCHDATCVVLPGSPDGRDLAARLAACLGWPLLANALAVADGRAVIAHHGGRLQSDVVTDAPVVVTLQPGVRGAAAAGDAIVVDGSRLDGPAATDADFDADAAHAAHADAEVLGVEPPEAATMDLAEAPRIIVGGAGLMGAGVGAGPGDDPAERFEQLAAVGAALGASMGATRVVTDAGWVHHDRQIGTTGVVVDPDLYLAFGISGAVQHTAGLGNPDHVISVNTDPHCPMMALADLAVVADAPAVLDELAARLRIDEVAS